MIFDKPFKKKAKQHIKTTALLNKCSNFAKK